MKTVLPLVYVLNYNINPTFLGGKVSFITCMKNLLKYFNAVSHSQNQLVVTRSTSSQAFARNINLQCSPRFFFISSGHTSKIHSSPKPVQQGEQTIYTPPPLLLPCPDYVVGNIIQGGKQCKPIFINLSLLAMWQIIDQYTFDQAGSN